MKYKQDGRKRLGDLRVGERAVIGEIEDGCALRRRLLDLGLVRGTTVHCVGVSPGRDMKAFRVRGAVIALRNEDSHALLIAERQGTTWD